MTSYNPVVKNDAGGAVIYTSLEPRAPTGAFQADPTLATGDVKISIDGGVFTNLGTLPDVEPNGGKAVTDDYDHANGRHCDHDRRALRHDRDGREADRERRR